MFPFFKPSSPFSNWNRKTFGKDYQFELDGNKYKHMEQYMMAQKALTFDDFYMYKKIMKTESARSCKRFGRNVINFDGKKWDEVKYDIVKKGLYAKFTQNEEFKKNLLDTKKKIICEASPYDKIWGIGLKATDPKINTPEKWRGENLLGKILMEIRDEIE